MKQIVINQIFKNNIEDGILDFYIQKKYNDFAKWTKVELVTLNGFKCDAKAEGSNSKCGGAFYCRAIEDGKPIYNFIDKGVCYKKIKEKMIVEMKITDKTAFEIGSALGQRLCINRNIAFLNEGNFKLTNELEEKVSALEYVLNTVNKFFKQTNTLYWYEIKLVKNKSYQKVCNQI